MTAPESAEYRAECAESTPDCHTGLVRSRHYGEGEMILRHSLPVLLALVCGFGALPAHPVQAAAPPVSATLTLFADQKSVTSGGRVRLSGTLRGRTADDEVLPLPAEEIEIDDLSADGEPPLKDVTRTDGSYAVTTVLRESAVFQARFTLGGQQVTSAPVSVRVLAKTLFYDFKIDYSPARRLQATARFELGADLEDPSRFDIALQYSPDGKKNWKTVTYARPDVRGRLAFRPFTHSPGWWRLRFSGDDHFAAAVSKVRKAWRWKTSFAKVAFTPRRLKVGKKITVTGFLYRTDARHRSRFPYARQRLAVIFLCGGTWRVAATGATDAKGHFKIKAGTWCDARYQVVFDGTPKGDTLRAYSKSVKIDTTGKPTLSRTTTG